LLFNLIDNDNDNNDNNTGPKSRQRFSQQCRHT
jgi:hypothetical protein